MDLDDLLEQAKGNQPPGLDPMGQCPYCHRDLMKKELRLPSVVRRLVKAFATDWDVLLTYWVCMNEECCLMYWRHPRSSDWVPPIHDDLLEH